ncbi:hypothetical protein [Guyparkeria halopsychrophila]|uniref:hypothetical protein n=1 Tax=Guyparkeria halopsychrophila TaxID=3139421 RepID=UPI0037CC4971
MKFMHLVTLLLAFWAPLNAVTAGVAMLDCPIDEMVEHSADCPSTSGATEEATTSTGCDHCGNCVLLGGFSLPAQPIAPAIHLANGTLDAPLVDSMAAGVASTPFRPPLSA